MDSRIAKLTLGCCIGSIMFLYWAVDNNMTAKIAVQDLAIFWLLIVTTLSNVIGQFTPIERKSRQ